MASIYRNNRGWRAQVCVGGVRESAMFDEKFQAEAWAHDRELALGMIRRSIVAAHRVINDKKTFVDASASYSSEDIIKSSTSVIDTSGVYFLIRDGVIVYVGQSKAVYSRIEKHRLTKHFDRITVLECEEGDLLSLEANYIKKFKPILNVVGIDRFDETNLIRDAVFARAGE